MKEPTVYMLASRRRGTLYTGVTSNLLQRVEVHKEGVVGGFTHRYGVKKLVWFERHDTMAQAFHREKYVKNLPRVDKIKLVEELNPEWRDLLYEME